MTPFSVLMAVYEKENPAHFRMALASNLEEQTLLPAELVLVCDGPLTPELDAVITEYEEKFPAILKVFRLEENVGLGKGLNYGLAQCTCDLVARADSDDICLPERFRLQTEYMAQHPEVSVVSSAIDEFAEDPACPIRQKLMPSGGEELKKYAKTRNPVNHMTAMFRKADVEKAGSYQHMPYLEDYFLWVRMLVMGMEISNLPQKLVLARVGNGMASRRGDKRQLSARKQLYRYMVEHGFLTKGAAACNMLELRLWCLVPTALREFVYKTILRRQE